MEDKEYLRLIGENITKIRKQKGLTSKELGYLCDIEKSNLIPIEKGRINVTALTLIKIAKAMQVHPKDFWEF